MATTPGLDPSNINLYGAAPADTEEYQKALQASVSALEQRYANPNWFNVAAGFLKPQLGGFAASLGSAGQAMGENLEKQRESQLPIAQMRAQLAASKIAMGQKSTAAKEFSDWQATGKPMSEAIYSRLIGLAPGSATAEAAKAAYTGEQTNQTLRTAQQDLLAKQVAQENDILTKQRQAGTITQDEYNTGLAALRGRLGERPAVVPAGTTNTAEGPRVTTPPPEGTKPFGTTPPPAGGPTNASSSAKSIVKIDGVPVDAGTELEALIVALPGFTGKDAEDARKLIAQLKGATPTAPSAGADNFADFKIKPSITIKHPQAVTEGEKAQNAAAAKAAATLESNMEKQYQNLQTVNEPAAFDAAETANRFVLKELDTKPEMAAATTNMLRKAGPAAAMLQKGVGISFGPYGAHVNLDVLSGLKAGLKTPEQEYQDAVVNALARSVYYDLKSRGIDPEKEGAEKFGQRMLQETNIEQGPAAIRHAVKTNSIRLEQNRDLFSAYNELMPGAVAQGSISPLHDISTQHPKIKVLKGLYKKRFEQEDNAYSEGIKRKAP
jgi:hypothetical protein